MLTFEVNAISWLCVLCDSALNLLLGYKPETEKGRPDGRPFVLRILLLLSDLWTSLGIIEVVAIGDVLLEVLDEHARQFVRGIVEALLVIPGVAWVE